MSLSRYFFKDEEIPQFWERLERLIRIHRENNGLTQSQFRELFWAEKRLDKILYDMHDRAEREGRHPVDLEWRVVMGDEVWEDGTGFPTYLIVQHSIHKILLGEASKTGRPSKNGYTESKLLALACAVRQPFSDASAFSTCWEIKVGGKVPPIPKDTSGNRLTASGAAAELLAVLRAEASDIGVKQSVLVRIKESANRALSRFSLELSDLERLIDSGEIDRVIL